MKTIHLFAILLGLSTLACLTSCGSSKKATQDPKSTYVMPCSEYTSGNGVLRAWAMGKSDSEMTARKKAQTSASADLAAMLTRTVQSTTEDYAIILTEGNDAVSKTFLTDKTKITVNKAISGATVICERWTKDKNTNQYTNYVVMELIGESYLKELYEELSKEQGVEIDRNLLERLFLKHIEDANDKH